VRSRHAEPLGFAPVGSPTWRAYAARTTISFFIGPPLHSSVRGRRRPRPSWGLVWPGVPWQRLGRCRRDHGNGVCVRCWRPSERRAVAAVSSAIERAIVSKVVASAVQQRETALGRGCWQPCHGHRSRHPALRMAPAPSSRRQCPR